MKLNYKRTTLIGLAFLSISAFWQMYDNVIPLVLKTTFGMDEALAGMVMAAVRMNVPAIVCSGGPMLAGTYNGEEVILSKLFEAVGAYKAGMIDECKLEECETGACPGCGSCAGMYTANSMNCLCEAVGIALPGNGTIPAVSSKRTMLAKYAGMAIMNLVEKGITARDIINEKSLTNALACDMALGCSTNSMLHLPAIAHECGIDIDLDIANDISRNSRHHLILVQIL